MKKGLFICFLCLSHFLSIAQRSSYYVHTAIKREFEKSGFPGMAVSVVSDTGIVYVDVMGYRDVENQKRYNRETVQNIGSISKTLIGIAVMKVVEMGLIKLDTDLNLVLPFSIDNPYYPDEKITLRQLATHTSSIRDRSFVYNKSYVTGQEADKTNEDFLHDYLSFEGLWYKDSNYNSDSIGTRYEYSNIGAALAAFTVEYLVKMPFDEFTHEYILKPSKMILSGWSYDDINYNNHIVGYDKKGNAVPEYTLVTYPDGGLRSTIIDLSFYLMEMINGYYGESMLLEVSSWQEIFSPQLEDVNGIDLHQQNSGIFWEIRGGEIIGHTGSDPGITAIMFFNPKTKIGKIFLTNSEFNRKTTKSFQEIWKKLDSVF